MTFSKRAVRSLVVFSFLIMGAYAQDLPSLRIADRMQIETPTNALNYYGSGIGHANGYGAGRSDELKSTAFGLSYNADTIYTYVRDHVEYYPTFGLGKGALGAHLDKSGNAFDQAALMVDLLQESAANGAAISGIQYRLGTLSLTGMEAESLFDVSSAQQVCRLMANGGIPGSVNGTTNCASVTGRATSVQLMHVWVTARVNGVDRVFDPAFKPTAPISNMAGNWKTGMAADCRDGSLVGYSNPTLSTASTARGFQNASIAARYQACVNQMWNWLEANAPDASLDEVLAGSEIVPHAPGQTSLAPSKYNISLSFSAIPDAYRTKVSLNARIGTVENALNYSFFADEIYGKRLALEPNGFDNTTPLNRTCNNNSGQDYNYRVQVLLDDQPIGAGFASDCIPPSRGAVSVLSIDLPYAAENGTYLDTSYTYALNLVTRAVLGLSLGDYGNGTAAHTTRRLGLDRSTFAVREENFACPAECDPPRGSIYGSRLAENVRYNLFTSWAKQFTSLRDIIAQNNDAQISHHYSMGWVSARTFVNWVSESWGSQYGGGPVDPVLLDNEFSIGDEGVTLSFVTAVSNVERSTDDMSTRRLIANGAAMLEASVFDQLMDTAASTGVGNRFHWANLANRPKPTDISYNHYGDDPQGAMNFFRFLASDQNIDFDNKLTSDGELNCTPERTAKKNCFKQRYISQIREYLNAGYNVTAAQDAYMGPGFRCGFTTVGGNANGITFRLCEPNIARAGAFIAAKPDYSEIAYIDAYAFYDNAKGGGAGAAAPDELARLQTPTSADLLKNFEENPYIDNIDLKSGNLNYTTPALISTGTRDFPYALSFSRTLTSGDIGYDSPVWKSSWHMPASVSGSGDSRLGGERALFAAPTLAAILILDGIYDSNASDIAKDVVGAVTSTYWAQTLTHNAISVGLAGGTEQFIRRPGTQEFWPTKPSRSRVIQSGTRYRGQPPSSKGPGFATSEAWLVDNLSFELQTGDNQTIHYDYWQSRHPAFGEPGQWFNQTSFFEAGMKNGFHATRWDFPTGMRIDFNYSIDQNSCEWAGGCSKPILNSVRNNLGHQLNFVGIAENPTQVSASTGQSITLTDTAVTHPDGSITAYDLQFAEGCSRRSAYSGEALSRDCIKHNKAVYLRKLIGPGYSSAQPSMSVAYDDAGKVRTLSNAEGQSWTFRIGGGRMAKTTNPLNSSTSVTYDADGNSVATMTPPLTN